jgi:hypothetical protein
MHPQTISYRRYERGLPQEHNYILGQTRGDNIIVYQAFNDPIADCAIANQQFGGAGYSFDRMTWIKPNFLWMMYRSGWGQKDNQNRILAIEMTLMGFNELLRAGVLTSYDRLIGTKEDWRARLEASDVRVQWDPDHDAHGANLKRRAVQIGIKGETLQKFNNEYIRSITDITDFVNQQKKELDSNGECFMVMEERIIEVDEDVKEQYSIPKTFISPFVQGLITEFEKSGEIKQTDFERLLTDKEDKREEIIDYIKNYEHVDLSRYLLKTAIAYRKEELGKCGCRCEDLLLFSYFASKNKSGIDFDLIMEAKLADFDTWCGFDGEMIFYTLGYEGTKDYLSENVEKFGRDRVEYFLEFDEEYLYNDINCRAFWYLY